MIRIPDGETKIKDEQNQDKMQKVAMSTYTPIFPANLFHAIAAEHAEYF